MCRAPPLRRRRWRGDWHDGGYFHASVWMPRRGASPARPRLIAHDLIIGEHLLDCCPRWQLPQFIRRPGEELPAVGGNWRAATGLKTTRCAPAQEAHYGHEGDEPQQPIVHVVPQWFCACAQPARHCGQLALRQVERPRRRQGFQATPQSAAHGVPIGCRPTRSPEPPPAVVNTRPENIAGASKRGDANYPGRDLHKGL